MSAIEKSTLPAISAVVYGITVFMTSPSLLNMRLGSGWPGRRGAFAAICPMLLMNEPEKLWKTRLKPE